MRIVTYRLVLDLLGLSALERNAVALVLQTLGSNQSLDLGGLGVRLLALSLGLDLTSDDVLADLYSGTSRYISLPYLPHVCTYIFFPFSDSTRWCTLQGILLSHPAEATTEQVRTCVAVVA